MTRYYWGPHLSLGGTLRYQWEFRGQGSNRPKFTFRLTENQLRFFRTGGAVGDLRLHPVEVVVEPRFGPRPDVQLVYTQLCWVGTVFPPCSSAVVPSLYPGGRSTLPGGEEGLSFGRSVRRLVLFRTMSGTVAV